MAKTLPSGEIQVEQGDTLSGIYGSNWKELSGYTGDPTKLPIGQVLPAKSSGSLGGSLAGGGEEKALPDQPIDGLSRFGDMLKMITQRSAKESMAKGSEALPEGMLAPEQVSGSTFANVLNTVTKQKTRGIADIYQSTMDMISDTRTRANDQLQTLISTKGITKLDDISLERLSGMTDYNFEDLKAIKTSLQEEGTDPPITDDGLAVFTDASGTEYDFGKVEGLNKYLADNPEYTYADMNAFLDKNVKGMDASTRKGLLDSSDFGKASTERKYDAGFYKKEIRKQLREDPEFSEADFAVKMGNKYSKMTPADGKMLINFYLIEKEQFDKLSSREKKIYLK